MTCLRACYLTENALLLTAVNSHPAVLPAIFCNIND